MLRISYLIWICVFMISHSLWAVPGLEKVWLKMYPGSTMTCHSCHQTNFFAEPGNKNVSEEGRKKYQEILRFREEKLGVISDIKPILKVDFVVFGDSRSDLETNKLIVKQLSQDNPKAVFHTGDVVANGSETSEWDAIIPLYRAFIGQKNFYHSCGNHEGDFCTKNPLRKKLGNEKLFYSVEFQGLTFLALDSNRFSSEQLKWLTNLPSGKKYVPFFHHPAYPVLAGHSGSDGVIKNFVPHFKRLGVKLVFTGHNHGYDRNERDGITYITSGGGGAPLYPCGEISNKMQFCLSDYHYLQCSIDKASVTCQAKLIDGTLADSITVKL